MDSTNTLNSNQQPSSGPGASPVTPPIPPLPTDGPPAQAPTPVTDPAVPPVFPVTENPLGSNLPNTSPLPDLNPPVGAPTAPPEPPAPTFSYPQPAPADTTLAAPSTPGVLGSESPPAAPSEALDLSNPNVPVFASQPPSPDQVPTDLSHLIGGNQTPAEPASAPAAPQAAQPTMVVGGTEAPVASGSHGFPKKIVLGAVVILLLVTAASAYFILGIGQTESTDETTSLPAEQELTAPPSAVIPTIPQATSSGFGTVSGATPSGVAATPTATSGASAIDRLKGR